MASSGRCMEPRLGDNQPPYFKRVVHKASLGHDALGIRRTSRTSRNASAPKSQQQSLVSKGKPKTSASKTGAFLDCTTKTGRASSTIQASASSSALEVRAVVAGARQTTTVVRNLSRPALPRRSVAPAAVKQQLRAQREQAEAEEWRPTTTAKQGLVNNEKEKVATLLSIVGDVVDEGSAMAVLESVGGDVELAIGRILDTAQPVTHRRSARDATSGAHEKESATLSAPEMRMLLDSHGVDHSACKRRDELTGLFRRTFDVDSEACDAAIIRTFHPPPRCGGARRPQQRQRSNFSEECALAGQKRAERLAQDEEYQEALLIDQQKEASRQAIEEEARRLEEDKRQLVIQAERLEAQRRKVLEQKQKTFLEISEPSKFDSDTCHLVVRVPSGRRITRVFRASDTFSLVYDWIDVTCDEEEFTSNNYLLVSQVPGQSRQEFTQKMQSLRDAGFVKQNMLFIACID